MAIVSGVVWGVIESLIPFFFLNLLLGAGVGYAIGEVVSLSVNRKRGKGLASVAGIAVAVSYLVNIFLIGGLPFGLFSIVLDLIAMGLGVFIAVTRLR